MKHTRKVLSILLVFCMAAAMFAMTGCGNDKSEKSSKKEDKKASNVYEIDGNLFELADSSLITDYDGDTDLVTTWKFTNNTDEATSSTFILFYEFTQDGNKMDSPGTIFLSEDSYDTLTDFEFEEVQPGETGTFFLCYKILDPEKPVDLRISDLMDEDVYEIEIPVNEMELTTVDTLDIPETAAE